MTEMTQQLAQASMLGGMQATLQNVERTAGETLAIVRGQEARINKVEANDGVQNTRLDAHDREFVGLRTELAGSRLTWPKLLAGFSALGGVGVGGGAILLSLANYLGVFNR
ncbi:MAG TPA: hypothetical protein VIS29_06405 [Streptomyces sp.]|jgi:hypothetical protein